MIQRPVLVDSIGGTGTSATLAIELRAPDIDRSVWYGTVEQSWEEHLDADERIETAVATLLRYFPPGNAKGRPLKTSEGEERIRE